MQENPFVSLLRSPENPIIMGILNITPDSFSDGGLWLAPEAASDRALLMLMEGADMIDIGGASTRPPGATYGAGAQPVDASEEAARVLPVIRAILDRVPEAIISIDTTHAIVARHAIQAGASAINDVSAGTNDPEMFATAADLGVPIVLMHGYGTSFQEPRVDDYVYADVVREVFEYLEVRIRSAREAGIETVIADVGIGFAKGFRDNLRLMREHRSFEELGVSMLFGASRKSSIGHAMNRDTLPNERVAASVAAAIHAAQHGARIVRVHDVRETTDAFSVLNAIEGIG